jgi:hypothetical protein
LDGVRLRGSSVTFAGAAAERVELRMSVDGMEHDGTVAVRGPLSSLLSKAQEAGLDEAQARALEFVAAWFGSPFDAASARAHREPLVTWGFWRFGPAAIARCLAAWKRRDPGSFAALLERYGFDVHPGAEGEAPSPPSLSVADPASGEVASGRAAEHVMASEPRLFAALARAGRHPAAHAAQIEVAAVESLLPALRLKLPVGDNAPELGVLLRSPRAIAALFYTDLAFGLRGVRHFAQGAGAAPADRGDEEWIEQFASRLERSGRAEHAHALRRILSSPELR